MTQTPIIKRSFAPVVDRATRVLLLGSLPGEASLARGQYYAHPRNQFWRLIGDAVGRDLTALGYQDRLNALLAAGIGLWDVVESASRAGSLDGAIRDHSANDLRALVDRLPHLGAVAFNGGKAASIGRRQLGIAVDFERITLPSSSPAYTMPFEAKLAEWARLRAYLQ